MQAHKGHQNWARWLEMEDRNSTNKEIVTIRKKEMKVEANKIVSLDVNFIFSSFISFVL